MTASAVKGRRSRRKRAGSTTGVARYTQVEHLQSGGRVQRPNLSSLTVYLQSCHSYILAQPTASIGVRLQARQSDRRSCPRPPNSTPQRYCTSPMRSAVLSAPFHSLFYVYVMILNPPRSPPQLPLPPIAEDAAGLLGHDFDLLPQRLDRVLVDVRGRPHPVIMAAQSGDDLAVIVVLAAV